MSIYYPLSKTVNTEIGSEFWLHGLPSQEKVELPIWLQNFGGSIVLTSSGRGAISLILKQAKPRYRSVLLPDYICDSVITPFIEAGYKCYFYKISKDLTPDLDSLLNHKKIGILIHLGYFGFDTNAKLNNTILNYKEKGTLIIEDITHTLFSSFERNPYNDYLVGSIRKWFGTPGGGFVASNNNSSPLKSPTSNDIKAIPLRKEALLAKGEYILRQDYEKKEYALKKFSDAEVTLNNDVSDYRLDEISKKIIANENIREIILKRRENFQELSKEMGSIKGVEVIFEYLEDSTCPMFYPIFIESKKNELRDRLRDEGIYCPVHWPVPSLIEKKNLSYDNNSIYKEVLSIPCDQRYDKKDMKRIISVFQSILS